MNNIHLWVFGTVFSFRLCLFLFANVFVTAVPIVLWRPDICTEGGDKGHGLYDFLVYFTA